MFEDFYKKHLSTRLLTDNSGDREDEKMMISKVSDHDAHVHYLMVIQLKAECGHQFTSRLEGMFNDIKISTDMMSDFKKQLPKRSNLGSAPDINVTVLTTGFWPVFLRPNSIRVKSKFLRRRVLRWNNAISPSKPDRQQEITKNSTHQGILVEDSHGKHTRFVPKMKHSIYVSTKFIRDFC